MKNNKLSHCSKREMNYLNVCQIGEYMQCLRPPKKSVVRKHLSASLNSFQKKRDSKGHRLHRQCKGVEI